MIKQESVQNVLDSCRIEDVLGDFLNLRKRGTNFTANCPFHDEKTPSFSVSPSKGLYKCFGCGKAGTSVTFLMDHEKLSFVDSIRYLAKKYNIKLEETEESKEEVEKKNHKESLMIVMEYATKIFQQNLETEEGSTIGKSYFIERGFDEKTIKDFSLGYCMDSWDAFSEKAIRDGYNKDFLIQLGLSKENEKGTLRDFFKGRVIFPIHNLLGKPIGIGARVLKTSDKSAKYLNSPENEIYYKSQVLYGLHLAKKAIPKDNYCLLVEGYTDVISLYQAGIENVVSSSGTALTIEQTKLIRRFSENLYILYDGDNAGIKAALRGIEIALESGLNVRIVLLPPNHDPDSYVKAFGGEHLKQYIETTSQDIVMFKANLYQEEAGNDPVKKSELVRDIIKTLSLISDTIKRSFYLKECSLLMEIDEEILSRELQKYLVNKRLKGTTTVTNSSHFEPIESTINEDLNVEINNLQKHKSHLVLIELELCKILLEYGEKKIDEDNNPFFDPISVVEYVVKSMLVNFEFESEICKKIFYTIKSNCEQGLIYPLNYYLNHSDQEISQFAIQYCNNDVEQLANWNFKENQVRIVQYGQNYVKEVEEIVHQAHIVFYEKLGKSIYDTTLQIINNDKTLNDTTLKQLLLQQEFLNHIKEKTKNLQNVFRNRIV